MIGSYFIGSLIGAIIGTFIGSAVGVYFRQRKERREGKKFLRYIRVTYPNAKVVEAISTSDTDKQALENVERRIRDASRNL